MAVTLDTHLWRVDLLLIPVRHAMRGLEEYMERHPDGTSEMPRAAEMGALTLCFLAVAEQLLGRGATRRVS